MVDLTEALFEGIQADPGYWEIVLDDDYTLPDTCIIVHDIGSEEEAEAFFRAHFREFVGSIADDKYRYITYYAAPSSKKEFDEFYAKDYNKDLLNEVEGYLKTWDYQAQLAKEEQEQKEREIKEREEEKIAAEKAAKDLSMSIKSFSPTTGTQYRDAANIDELIKALQEIKNSNDEFLVEVHTRGVRY